MNKEDSKMRLLKINVNGLSLFNESLDIDFFAEQRVSSDNNEMVSKCFGNIYTNNAISIVGINASGKTTLLKLLSFVVEFINGEPINNIIHKDILNNSEKLSIVSYFFDPANGLCKLESEIIKVREKEIDPKYIVSNERLWIKRTSNVKSKKDLFEFSDNQIVKIRDNNAEYLKNDISIVISINKTTKFYLKDLIRFTNVNFLSLNENFPHELIAFLDPNIEKITYDKKSGQSKLKFYDKNEIIITNPLNFEKYLSSGTIKGINIFINAMMVFEKGGYLIVDEIENHFHREIVVTLIRFFMNKKINKNGATIIFSTHYSELLDEFERNDNIYIVRNRNGIYPQKLSEILTRNDIKKSEAFKSNFLDGTVPTYESYINLKNAFSSGKIKGA